MTKTIVRQERTGAVAVLTINRPETQNALNSAVLEALEEAFAGCEQNSEVRAIVLTGAGDKAFVAGGDIADLDSRRGLAHYIEYAELIHRVFRRIEASDKPTLAAINGWALGGGFELMLTTDLRLASDTARLGLPEINLGLFPGAGGSQRALRELSPCQARRLMFLGEPIDAAEALSLGLINEVVPAAQLVPRALELATQLASKSPLVLKLLKRTLRDGGQMTLPAALAYEQAMIGLVLDTEDAHEGCRAFLDKRPASFKGA